MPLIRSFVMLVVALVLAFGPVQHSHAAGMGSGLETTILAHRDPEGCASAMALHGQTQKHDAGGCAKMNCCPGAICVLAGLPAATALAVPMAAAMLNLLATDSFLSGRDVAPPLDPPRPLA